MLMEFAIKKQASPTCPTCYRDMPPALWLPIDTADLLILIEQEKKNISQIVRIGNRYIYETDDPLAVLELIRHVNGVKFSGYEICRREFESYFISGIFEPVDITPPKEFA